jgi:nucleoside recognition membrane protein YjiH
MVMCIKYVPCWKKYNFANYRSLFDTLYVLAYVSIHIQVIYDQNKFHPITFSEHFLHQILLKSVELETTWKNTFEM